MPRVNRLIAGEVSGVMTVWASVARERSHDVRHQRRTPPRSTLAGVEAFAAQAVRYRKNGFGFGIVSLTRARCDALRQHWHQAVGSVYISARWPVATSSVPARPQGWADLNYSTVAVEVCAKATACSAA